VLAPNVDLVVRWLVAQKNPSSVDVKRLTASEPPAGWNVRLPTWNRRPACDTSALTTLTSATTTEILNHEHRIVAPAGVRVGMVMTRVIVREEIVDRKTVCDRRVANHAHRELKHDRLAMSRRTIWKSGVTSCLVLIPSR
jgi:hypothetical protein